MTEITLTAKIQVIVDKSDKKTLTRTMSAYVDACNFVSKHIFETHDLVQPSLNRALYQTLRSKFELRSQMAQSVIKTVIAKYKTIKKNQPNDWIEPNFKHPQYDLVWNKDYSLNEGYFSVNSLDGRLKLPYVSKGMEKYFNKDVYKFGTAKLVKKHKKYFLHIPVTFEIEECLDSEIQNIVGVDRGINFIVATYDSKHQSKFISGRFIKRKRANYVAVRRSLQRRKTRSARRRMKLLGQRENRWMQDVNHVVSKALVEQNPTRTMFVLEDLTGIRAVTEKVHHKRRYVSVSWSFYDLEQKLMYKAARRGSKVIKVPAAYTSQTCPKCGHVEKSNRDKKKHRFCCKACGYRSNDDRVAAMNLYRMGIEYRVQLS